MVDLPASPVPRTSILVMACAHGAELSRADSSLARSRVWLRTGTCSSLYIFSRSAAILRDASSASCELSSDLEPSLKQQHHRGALPCGESVSISRAARGERTDTSQTQGARYTNYRSGRNKLLNGCEVTDCTPSAPSARAEIRGPLKPFPCVEAPAPSPH